MPLVEFAIAAGDYFAADAAATTAGEAALADMAGLGATDMSLGAAGVANAAGSAGLGDLLAAQGFGDALAAQGLAGSYGAGIGGLGAAGSAVGSLPGGIPIADAAGAATSGATAPITADINAMGDVGMGAYGSPTTAAAPGGAWDSVTRWWDGLSGTQKAMMGIMGLNMMGGGSKVPVQQPYTGGNLQYFKYDPRTYQPAVATPPTPYTPQYRRYAAGGGIQGDTAMSQGQMPGALTMETMEPVVRMATGGISNLGSYSDGGRMLKGPGDGMSDSIPASISGKQPARLADGEFVVPADVVSGLGNGSTDAGAKQLYKMLDKVRSARTGTKRQGREINPDKYTPA